MHCQSSQEKDAENEMSIILQEIQEIKERDWNALSSFHRIIRSQSPDKFYFQVYELLHHMLFGIVAKQSIMFGSNIKIYSHILVRVNFLLCI